MRFLRGRSRAANDALLDDDAPPTLRDPTTSFEQVHASARPAVFDALCASLEVLAAEELSCELDVVVEPGCTSRLYRDPELAARLLSPFVSRMPAREGLVAVGTLRVAGRRVRIYERAA